MTYHAALRCIFYGLLVVLTAVPAAAQENPYSNAQLQHAPKEPTPATPAKQAVALKQSCDLQWGKARMDALAKTGADMEEGLRQEVDGRTSCASMLGAFYARVTPAEQAWLQVEIKRQYFARDEAASLLSTLRKKRLSEEQSEQGQRLKQRQVDLEREIAEKALQEVTGRSEPAEAKQKPQEPSRVKIARPPRERQPREPRERPERSGVRCCDGSMSPTCTYVHRGCCSHHGGVCD